MDYIEQERIQQIIDKITHTIGGNEIRYLKLKGDQQGPYIIGDLKYPHSENWNLFQLWHVDGQWNTTLRTTNENDLQIN
jgi:hypothetical protein